MIERLIERIEGKYDPENDMPEGVQVTWVDMYLLEIIKAQQEEIDILREDIRKINFKQVALANRPCSSEAHLK